MSYNNIPYFPPPPQQPQNNPHRPPPRQSYIQPEHQTSSSPPLPLRPPPQQMQHHAWAPKPANLPPPTQTYNPATFTTTSQTQFGVETSVSPPSQPLQQQRQYPGNSPHVPSISSRPGPSTGYFHPPLPPVYQPLPAQGGNTSLTAYHLQTTKVSQMTAWSPSLHDFIPFLPPSDTETKTDPLNGSFSTPSQKKESSIEETVVEEVIEGQLVVQEAAIDKEGELQILYSELFADEDLATRTTSEQLPSSNTSLQTLSPESLLIHQDRQSSPTSSPSAREKVEFGEPSMEPPPPPLPPRRQLNSGGEVKEEDQILTVQHVEQMCMETTRLPTNLHSKARESSEKLEPVLPTMGSALLYTPPEEKFETLSIASQELYPPPPYSLAITQSSPLISPQHSGGNQHISSTQFPTQEVSAIHSLTSQSTASIPAHHPRPPLPHRDSHQSGKVKRFFGDTLVGRVARSTLTTATSTIKAPAVLSPWGDNNPVTLPNVRYRDALLFGTFAVMGAPLIDGASDLVSNALGADNFIADVISSGAGFVSGTALLKYGLFQVVEQGIDKTGLERVIKERQNMTRTTCCLTVLACVRHKLLDTKAVVKFVGQYAAYNHRDSAKGWFVPYLFATCRVALIPRASDFGIAEVWEPGLCADSSLASTLLSQIPNVIPFCDPNPTAQNLPYARVLITFLGISPLRAEMWSTSRRPGCAQIKVHLLDGCPGLVIPVPLPIALAGTAAGSGMAQDTPSESARGAPVLAWSPWTLRQMLTYQQRQQALAIQPMPGVGGHLPSHTPSPYTASRHYDEICSWALSVVDRKGLDPKITGAGQNAFEQLLGASVGWIVNGALAAVTGMGGKDGKVFGAIDPDRAGVVAFRY